MRRRGVGGRGWGSNIVQNDWREEERVSRCLVEQRKWEGGKEGREVERKAGRKKG